MKISMVVAMGKNRVIGIGSSIPWHIPGDIQHFKNLTMNHPVIMGWLTWKSIPEKYRPLPGRTNIVLSRTEMLLPVGVVWAGSEKHALYAARNSPGSNELMIVGGSQIYALFMLYADTVYATCVDISVPDGDVFFPEFKQGEWQLDVNGSSPQEPYNGIRYEYKTYRRIAGKQCIP